MTTFIMVGSVQHTVQVVGNYTTPTGIEMATIKFDNGTVSNCKKSTVQTQITEENVIDNREKLVVDFVKSLGIDSVSDYVGDGSVSVCFDNVNKTYSTPRGKQIGEVITVFVYVDRFEVETYNLEKEYKTGEAETSNRRKIKKLDTLTKWIENRIG